MLFLVRCVNVLAGIEGFELSGDMFKIEQNVWKDNQINCYAVLNRA